MPDSSRPAPRRRTPPSSPDCPRPRSTCTTSGPPRPGSSRSSPPGTRVRCPATSTRCGSSSRSATSAHFIEVYLAVVDLLKEPEDLRLLTYEVAAEMAAQNIRYAELTLTPWTSVATGIADRGLRRRGGGRAGRGRAGPRRTAPLDLRHPRRVRSARGRGHVAVRPAPRPRRAHRLRSRRSGGRRRSPAVQGHLRPGPGGGAAQRAARRGDDRPGDRVVGAARPRRRTDRTRRLRDPGPRAGRPPRRAPDPAGGLPDLQHRHPRRRPRSRTTRSGRCTTPASSSR